MASFKFHLRKSKKAGTKDGKLFIRIIHRRQYKDVATPHRLCASEWDGHTGRIVYHWDNPSRNDYLVAMEKHIRSDLSVLRMIGEKLEQKGDFTARDILAAFRDT